MSYAKPPREIVSNLYAMWSPSQTQRQRGSIEYFSVISINASSGALPSQHTHLRSCWINNTLEMGEMIHHNDARTLYFSRPAKTASLMISANLFLFFNRSDSEIHSPSTQSMSFLAHLRYIKKYSAEASSEYSRSPPGQGIKERVRVTGGLSLGQVSSDEYTGQECDKAHRKKVIQE